MINILCIHPAVNIQSLDIKRVSMNKASEALLLHQRCTLEIHVHLERVFFLTRHPKTRIPFISQFDLTYLPDSFEHGSDF